jgi:hypothetical protein
MISWFSQSGRPKTGFKGRRVGFVGRIDRANARTKRRAPRRYGEAAQSPSLSRDGGKEGPRGKRSVKRDHVWDGSWS